MIHWTTATLLLMVMGSSSTTGADAPLQFAQITIREQLIIRVPGRIRPVAPHRSSPIEWKESKGPKCVPAKSIVGASLLGDRSVDLVLRDQSRVRAKLESSCPALDYYYGFYIRPNADGQICADRDMIRSRVGGECEIEKFRSLTAKRETDHRLTSKRR